MANPYLALREMLSRQAPQTAGTVIEVLRDATYRVRTAAGSVEVKAAGNAAYAAGDSILVRDGIIQGRVKSAASAPVYNV